MSDNGNWAPIRGTRQHERLRILRHTLLPSLSAIGTPCGKSSREKTHALSAPSLMQHPRRFTLARGGKPHPTGAVGGGGASFGISSGDAYQTLDAKTPNTGNRRDKVQPPPIPTIGAVSNVPTISLNFSLAPNPKGMQTAMHKSSPVRGLADLHMIRLPSLYMRAHVSSKYYRATLQDEQTGGMYACEVDESLGFHVQIKVGLAESVPADALLHVTLFLAFDTVQRERIAMSAIGQMSLPLAWVVPAASGKHAPVSVPDNLSAVYPGDPILGSLSVAASDREAATRAFSFGPPEQKEPLGPIVQKELDRYMAEDYRLSWKTYRSNMTFPSIPGVRTPSYDDEHVKILGLMMPQVLFYYWASRYTLLEPVMFAESNVLLGCLAAGVDPKMLRAGKVSDARLKMILFWTAVAFPRAMSSVTDYRGSPHTPPLSTGHLDQMGGACVELTSLVTSVLQTLRDHGKNSQLCAPLVRVLSGYQIVQYQLTARSGSFYVGGRDGRGFISRHAAAGLIPNTLFEWLTTPPTERKDSSLRSSRSNVTEFDWKRFPERPILLDGLAMHSFSSQYPAEGRWNERESEFMSFGAFQTQHSPSISFGRNTRILGSCVRVQITDSSQNIRDLLCLGAEKTIAVDAEAMFGDRADPGRFWLKDSSSPSELCRLAERLGPIFEETSHLHPFLSKSARLDASAFEELYGRVYSAISPSVSRTLSVTGDFSTALRETGLPPFGWRVWWRANNDDDADASRLTGALNETSLAAQKLLKPGGSVKRVRAARVGSVEAYGGVVCELCYFVYES